MNKKRTFIYVSLCACMLLGSQLANAQAMIDDLNSALGFDNSVNDVPQAPINLLIGAMAMIGAVYGAKKLKKD